jgi:hypothetical protein
MFCAPKSSTAKGEFFLKDGFPRPSGGATRPSVASFSFCVIVLAMLCLGPSAKIGAQQPAKNNAAQAASQKSQPAQQGPIVENASRITPPNPAYHFPVGTVFYYKAEWRLFSAGIATLKLESDSSGQHRVSVTADATGFVARLFRVHDTFQSLFDPKTFCSAELNKHTEEGSRHRDSKLQFDYGRRKGVFEELNPKSGEKKHVENDIPECSTDVVSGVFYAASLPLEPGKSYFFPVNDGGKTVDLETRVEAREQIKTDAGTFNTLRIQPLPNSVLLKNKGRIWLWYSDDADRIPVQMRGRMGWGTVTIRLSRIERPAAQAAQTASQ